MQKQVIFLYLLVSLLLALEINRQFGWVNLPDKNNTRQQVLEEVKAELPALVISTIDTQIHELVLDKIELNRRVDSAKDTASDPVVLKVGNVTITKEQFLKRLDQLGAQPGFETLTREDRKARLVQELKRHYAVVQDAARRGMDQTPEAKEQMRLQIRKVFVAELIRQNVSVPGQPDVEDYYKKHQDLFSAGDVFSFRVIRSQNQDDLLRITSIQDFESFQPGAETFTQVAEGQIPFIFARSLRNIGTNTLSPILRDETWYYLLLKSSDVSKAYLPVEQVGQTILNQLAFQRIREYISTTSNPLRFEAKIDLNQSAPLIDAKPVHSSTYQIAREVLPAFFFTFLDQSPKDSSEFHVELELLLRKYEENPIFFGRPMADLMREKSDSIREIVLTQNMQKQLEASLPEPSEEELKNFYQANLSRLVQPAGELTQHIYHKDLDKARESLSLALMDPAHFPELARTRSEEARTSSQGGDMRFLRSEEITSAMNEAVKALKPGEVHPSLIPDTTGAGWHVLRFVAKSTTRTPEFAEVRPRLKEWAMQDRRNRQLAGYIEDVQKTYPATVDEKQVNAL